MFKGMPEKKKCVFQVELKAKDQGTALEFK